MPCHAFLLQRCVAFVMALLVVGSAGLGTARATFSPSAVDATAPLIEPEAEHKAMPAVERQLRRTQPTGDRLTDGPRRHAAQAIAHRAGRAPDVDNHRPRSRAPPELS